MRVITVRKTSTLFCWNGVHKTVENLKQAIVLLCPSLLAVEWHFGNRSKWKQLSPEGSRLLLSRRINRPSHPVNIWNRSESLSSERQKAVRTHGAWEKYIAPYNIKTLDWKIHSTRDNPNFFTMPAGKKQKKLTFCWKQIRVISLRSWNLIFLNLRFIRR